MQLTINKIKRINIFKQISIQKGKSKRISKILEKRIDNTIFV